MMTSLAAAALLIPLHATQQTATPQAPASAPPPASAPTEVVRPALPPTYEVQRLTPPMGMHSPVFGARVVAAADQLLLTGSVRARLSGDNGQIVPFAQRHGQWELKLPVAHVEQVGADELILQQVVGGGNAIATALERPAGQPCSVAVLEPGDRGWKQVTMLHVPHGLDRPGFGYGMSMDAGFLAVSTVNLRHVFKKDAPLLAPEVFVYQRRPTGWELDGTIVLPGALPGPDSAAPARKALWFGTSVALSGERLAVGTPAMHPPRVREYLQESGVALVATFVRKDGAWQLEAEVLGESVQAGKGFGNQVALEGDLMAVRAANVGEPNAPARVFVFRRVDGQWKSAGELVPSRGLLPSQQYGATLAISNGRVLVGDVQAREAGQGEDSRRPGMLFVFEERDGHWLNVKRLQPSGNTIDTPKFPVDFAVVWPWVGVGQIRAPNLSDSVGALLIYKLEP